MRIILVVTLVLLPGLADANQLSGEWISDMGALTLKQEGNRVRGSYPDGSLDGKVSGKKITFTWTEANQSGTGEFQLESPYYLSGSWHWANGNRGGSWRCWRSDPSAAKGKTIRYSGNWLSSLGTLVLEQDGDSVSGTYGSQGWGTLEGKVQGRRLDFQWRFREQQGKGWFEQAPDGTTFYGGTVGQVRRWIGTRIDEFVADAKPQAGKVVQGLSKNAMCYYVRAPKSWKSGDKVDAIVLLHGSNWTTAGMVPVTARMKGLGQKYMIIGIQGENWADWSTQKDGYRHNFSYVNFMGRSKHTGYPNTDRESPKLVADTVEELRKELHLGRVFLGGHSQGGYLAHIMHMHFPELFAGVFPIACGLVIQAEPDAFTDESLMEAQRRTPLALVHGQNDGVVEFKSGQYTQRRFVQTGFPYFRFFTPRGGHGYDFLPIHEVIDWLDALSTENPKQLLKFAKRSVKHKNWRDVAAALRRAEELGASKQFAGITKKIERAAKPLAKRYEEVLKIHNSGSWMPEFLEWYEQFEFAPSAQATRAAYEKLREQHEFKATKIYMAARNDFRTGRPEGGYKKYEQIIKDYYACSRYLVIKASLDSRE